MTQKISYLKALLKGPVARAIQGLAFSAANLETVIEILQTRFGNAQRLYTPTRQFAKLPVSSNKKQPLFNLSITEHLLMNGVWNHCA